jgi:hypothetical protein
MTQTEAGLEGLEFTRVYTRDLTPEQYEIWQELRLDHHSATLDRDPAEVASYVCQTTLDTATDRNLLVKSGVLTAGQKFVDQRLCIAKREGKWEAACRVSSNASSKRLRKPRSGRMHVVDLARGHLEVEAKLHAPFFEKPAKSRHLVIEEFVHSEDVSPEVGLILAGVAMHGLREVQPMDSYPYAGETYFKAFLGKLGLAHDGREPKPIPDAYGEGHGDLAEHWNDQTVGEALTILHGAPLISRGIDYAIRSAA